MAIKARFVCAGVAVIAVKGIATLADASDTGVVDGTGIPVVAAAFRVFVLAAAIDEAAIYRAGISIITGQ